jgi:hypothetical protein
MKTTNNILNLIIVCLVFFLVITSCENNSNRKIVWFKDPNGRFHTNDLKRAQKEIPFTIVIPNYIPDILGNNYVYGIVGPFKDDTNNSVSVQITYVQKDFQIYISEYNVLRVIQPNDELKPIYRDVDGIKVLQQEAQMAGGSGIIEGLRFNWNRNRLSFEVVIYNIPEEEGIKIVESMITQTE